MASSLAASDFLGPLAPVPGFISPDSSSSSPNPSSSPLCPSLFWTDLFRKSQTASPSTSLSSFNPSFVNGVVQVPTPIVEKGVAHWQEYLVGFILGKKLPLFLIRQEIEKFLKCTGEIELSAKKNSFLIKCKNREHRQLLLDGGPVFVASRIMVIQAWSNAVEAMQDHISSIPLWIKLEIPRELWHQDGLGFAASLFGKPLRMDEYTANMSKTKFARVCVTIDANFKFPASIPVNLGYRQDIVKAEYKWKPEICSKCLVFGHTEKSCVLAAGSLGANMGKTRLQGKQTWFAKEKQPAAVHNTEPGGMLTLLSEAARANNSDIGKVISATCIADAGNHKSPVSTLQESETSVFRPTPNRYSILSDVDEDISEIITEDTTVTGREPLKVGTNSVVSPTTVAQGTSIVVMEVNPVAVTGTRPGEASIVFLSNKDLNDDITTRNIMAGDIVGFEIFDDFIANSSSAATQANNQTEMLEPTVKVADPTRQESANLEDVNSIRPMENSIQNDATKDTVGSCLDMCDIVVDSLKISTVNKTLRTELVDKGGTSRPDTRVQATKQGDKVPDPMGTSNVDNLGALNGEIIITSPHSVDKEMARLAKA